MENILLAWSGGKDCTLALHKILEEKKYTITALLTTAQEKAERVSMHGVKLEHIRKQAESLNIPLEIVYVPENCTNEIYEKRMGAAFEKFHQQGIRKVAFGDIFLEDLRTYREDQMQKAGMKAVFPLWKNDTTKLSKEFLAKGYNAYIICIDHKKLDKKLAGCLYDKCFLSAIPDNVDPCGENGEFHTFVFAGPEFSTKIQVEPGKKVVKSYKTGVENEFVFCELD